MREWPSTEAGVPRTIAETIQEGKEGRGSRICVREILDSSKAVTLGTRKTAEVQCVASPAAVDHVMLARVAAHKTRG